MRQPFRRIHVLRAPRAWSLRTRLLFAQVVLLAMICALIGVSTSAALHRFLLNQLDGELVITGLRSAALFEVGPPPLPRSMPRPGGPAPVSLNVPGQSTGVLGAVIEHGHAHDAVVITDDGSRVELSDAVSAQLATVPETGIVTMKLDGLGSYRLVNTPTRHEARIVVGQPTAGVDQIMFAVVAMFCAVGAIALIVGAIASLLIIRHQLGPISEVAAAARDVAELDLARGDVSLPRSIAEVDAANTGTEVGQLSTALNRMLHRIADALAARQASEARVRQFVADASHELRTPLAAIRGYAEFARREENRASAEVAHAMGRVDSEARRMSVLVEDMLLLARLDTGRSLEQESVDLSRLAIDAVSDAHVSAPEHHWLLDLPEEPIVVTGDNARLHQVLVNLLSNCRLHTPAGTTTTVNLRPAVSGAAQLDVIDNGPGIPNALQPEVFERFARGDTSRSRRGGSSGLGLAIAAAIVNAHRGTITVVSRPGHTAFTITLPEAPRPRA
ncbi:sensor histidine kinase [Mycobacteroides salmoniphilum]|uniref:histidine kinase n=1 Tax=Mycobacteroides salmoniphilum TaxID=404941 RepID=A0A4R8SQB8_9MYCO|nr:HAMP domain-containing sensor histidine kinase [Mycobacteroides salmoniphilum]TDZ91385.1 putative sensor histidine kinase TcrY [Mycobacteroides salmoniphilum]TEA01262.1 putative sensor histidine kinase TcrY [Mycobacteroides salmoniphilum]